MKEKIKKWIKENIFKVAEIGIVIWAVNGILNEYSSWDWGTEYHITPVFAYFFSAVLILYLLRKYGRRS